MNQVQPKTIKISKRFLLAFLISTAFLFVASYVIHYFGSWDPWYHPDYAAEYAGIKGQLEYAGVENKTFWGDSHLYNYSNAVGFEYAWFTEKKKLSDTFKSTFDHTLLYLLIASLFTATLYFKRFIKFKLV